MTQANEQCIVFCHLASVNQHSTFKEEMIHEVQYLVFSYDSVELIGTGCALNPLLLYIWDMQHHNNMVQVLSLYMYMKVIKHKCDLYYTTKLLR